MAALIEERGGVRDAAARPDWILSVPLADPQRAVLEHGTFAQRGRIRAFLSGYLFEHREWAVANSLPITATPSEILAAAYERRGEAVLSKLRGSFAALVIDPGKNTAIACRDHLGSQPLFYMQAGETVAFAVLPAPLVSRDGADRSLNRAVLADHLCRRPSHPDETFFAAVRRVPPGWRAVIKDGRLRAERYWDPVPKGQAIEWLTEHEAYTFDEKLDRAVSRCLGLGRAGIFLSGGFDSVSIAAVAEEYCRTTGKPRPLALSLAFPDPESDETTVQQGVAEKLQLPFYLVDFHEAAGPRGLLAEGLALNASLDAPLFNVWAPAYLHLAREAQARGAKSVLTGSGGDEWLGVSPYLAADLLRAGDVSGMLGFVGTWRRSYHMTLPQLLKASLWTFSTRPLASMMLQKLAPNAWTNSRLRRLHAADPEWIAPGADLRAELRRRSRAVFPSADPPGGFYARESRDSLDHVLMSSDLEEQYQFGRLAGVNYMHPYWDPDLVAHIYRTPPALLLKGGRAKGLVRETVARRFPGLGFERQRKVSARTFYWSILGSQGPALAKAVGNLTALSSLGVIDQQPAQAFVAQAFREMKPSAFLAYHLLVQEVWARRFVDGSRP